MLKLNDALKSVLIVTINKTPTSVEVGFLLNTKIKVIIKKTFSKHQKNGFKITNRQFLNTKKPYSVQFITNRWI